MPSLGRGVIGELLGKTQRLVAESGKKKLKVQDHVGVRDQIHHPDGSYDWADSLYMQNPVLNYLDQQQMRDISKGVGKIIDDPQFADDGWLKPPKTLAEKVAQPLPPALPEPMGAKPMDLSDPHPFTMDKASAVISPPSGWASAKEWTKYYDDKYPHYGSAQKQQQAWSDAEFTPGAQYSVEAAPPVAKPTKLPGNPKTTQGYYANEIDVPYKEVQGMSKREAKGAPKRAWKQGYRVNAYHGTGKDLRPELPRSEYKDPIRWFTSDAKTALTYGHDNPMAVPVKLKMKNALVVDGDGRAWSNLLIKNVHDPKVAEALGSRGYGSELSTDAIVSEAKKQGYKAVVFRNIRDALNSSSSTTPSDVFAILDQSLIRGKYAKFANKNRGKLVDLLGGGVAAAGLGAAATQSKDEA